MKSTTKRQDNINVRIGHQTKNELISLATAYELSLAEFVRKIIREAIEEHRDIIDKNK